VSAALMVVLGALAVRRHRADPWAALTAAAVTGLLVSPVSWSHHWVWLLPAAAVAVKLRDRTRWLLVITALWVIAALLLYQFGHLAVVGSVSAYVVLAVAWLAALAVATPASEPTFVEVTPATV
jgi:alpha-1,2-mannosyltransferase